jgi:methionine synthase II (cobalamin-independent)
MIGAYLTGIFPRSEKLIEVTRGYERKRIDKGNLVRSLIEDTKQVVNQQRRADFDYVMDGMLGWQDLLRPFTNNLRGTSVGALSRWFNNNTFYWAPKIEDKLEGDGKILVKFIRFDCLPKDKAWKVTVPGPYTFSCLSENMHYSDHYTLMFDMAMNLRKEIRSLASEGVSYVQMSEPSLVFENSAQKLEQDTFERVKEAMRMVVEGLNVKTSVQTFFGDITPIFPAVLDLPVDCIGIDFFETNLESLKDYEFTKDLSCGCVNSRSSLIESQKKISNFVERVVNLLDPNDVFICPNTDLEFRPRDIAEKKVLSIGKAVKSLEERGYA